MALSWRRRAGAGVRDLKQEVVAPEPVVESNHPLASAAGMELLGCEGNAVDAATCSAGRILAIHGVTGLANGRAELGI